MCEYDRSRRDRAEPPQPVRPTVDHDTGVVVVNEQRAVTSMPARTELDFTPRAEEGQLNRTSACSHIDHLANERFLNNLTSINGEPRNCYGPAWDTLRVHPAPGIWPVFDADQTAPSVHRIRFLLLVKIGDRFRSAIDQPIF